MALTDDPDEQQVGLEPQTRTVGFFLHEEGPKEAPTLIEVCEVVATLTGGKWILYGDCTEANKNKRRCKHVKVVSGVYRQTHGHFLVELTRDVTPEQLAAAQRSPEEYRELILHRGVVQVLE